MSEPTPVTTVRHVREVDAALVELDLDADQAGRMARGESFGSYGEPRVLPNMLAIGRLTARQDQIEERMGELVDEYPQLKALPRHRSDSGDDLPPAA